MSTESETTDFATATQGRTFAFYGICGNQFKLDATVWEAIEDEADGYRSYLDAIERRDSDAIFFAAPLAQVRV